jgi:hypothetical protein
VAAFLSVILTTFPTIACTSSRSGEANFYTYIELLSFFKVRRLSPKISTCRKRLATSQIASSRRWYCHPLGFEDLNHAFASRDPRFGGGTRAQKILHVQKYKRTCGVDNLPGMFDPTHRLNPYCLNASNVLDSDL